MKHKKPNILWLMTDEQRKDSLGCYGSEWAHTSNLDRLAREGVLFRNAVTPAPVCVPARVSLLSGEYPVQTGVWDNCYTNAVQRGISLDHLTYRFHEMGYRSASFGKHHYVSTNRAFQHEHEMWMSEYVDPFMYGKGFDMADYQAITYPGHYPWILGGTFPVDA